MSTPTLNVTIDFSRAKARTIRMEGRVKEALDLWLFELGEYGVQIMREESPESTGELKSTIRSEVRGSTVRISPDVPYAIYVEMGTRAHTIYGKPVLSWQDSSGKRVWARVVHHPGTRPNPFMSRTRERLQAELRDRMIKRLRVAVHTE